MAIKIFLYAHYIFLYASLVKVWWGTENLGAG